MKPRRYHKGTSNQQLDQLLRNIGAIAHFLQRGREQLRQFLAGVLVWRQANHQEGSIVVDTQTTEEAQEPGPGDPGVGDPSGEAPPPKPGDPAGDSTGAEGATRAQLKPGDPAGDPTGTGREAEGGQAENAKWIPPLTLQQWSGSIPSTDPSQGSEPDDPTFPTDEELVEALEEYERQEEAQRLQEAAGDDVPRSPRPTEGEPDPTEHRRRRMLAAFTE